MTSSTARVDLDGNPIKPLTICMIGAGGFIGSHLCEKLMSETNHTVLAVDVYNDKIKHLLEPDSLPWAGRIQFHRINIKNDSRLEGLIKCSDLTVNLAAICTPADYNTRPLDTIYSNFIDALPVVKYCSENNKRLIHFSTCEVYGKTIGSFLPPDSPLRQDPAYYILKEDTSPCIFGSIEKQRWSYACAKQLIERLIYAEGAENGLEFTIVRPFNWIGPRMDFIPGIDGPSEGVPRVLACFSNNLLRREPLKLVDGGESQRTFVYIKDAIEAVHLMIENPARANGHIFNVGNPNNEVTVRQLAEMMTQVYAKVSGEESIETPTIDVSSKEFYGEGYDDSDKRIPDMTIINKQLVSEFSNVVLNMQIRTSNADGFRISVSSTPSCSNHTAGSGYDDIESLGDIFLWGEVWSDVGSTDGSVNAFPSKTDVTIPRLLESNIVIDVHKIACGVRHYALVTKQGELFTWGKESGGRLGHGLEKDFGRPRLVEFLAVTNVDHVSCGEFHTCAISTSGDLYTWGDGSHTAGLLGHGTDASHWIPKRISGPLEGLVVCSVACGTWHTALATVDGKLFTYGDGTFGGLGHGDRESLKYPVEVQSLNGLKVLKVACGVWHTAAIVEIANQHGGHSTSRKLFTWGDGEKHKLGHGNKETYLKPTCISALMDYNFHQLACGNTMTLALTTSGHVYSFGSTAYGQLGNPQSDGKLPALVQDELVGEFVEEIACGAYHAAVLTSRSEIFTWGMGANGRLGHGDFEDRKTPTLVESLKDRVVKSVSCGASFTTSICIHKWVGGADQSVCSGCKQAFGFTRKRHNCYNCGLVHCHACSSRKALKAAQAPIPGKPHRVCDSCYAKLIKKPPDVGIGIGSTSTYYRRFSNQPSQDGSRGPGPGRTSRLLMSPNIEPAKYLEIMSAMYGPKSDSYSSVRSSQVPSSQQLKDITFPSSMGSAFRPSVTASSFQMQPPFLPSPQLQPQPQPPPLPTNSRPAAPYSRRPNPPSSAPPMFSRGVIDNLNKSNELLNQQVSKLQGQVKTLKKNTERQDAELHKLQTYAEESASLASDRNAKCQVAVDVLKFVRSQLNTLTEKLPPDDESIKTLTFKVDDFLKSAPSRKIRSKKYPKVEENNVGETSKDGSKHSEEEKEVIEQFEPGVYVTIIQLSDGSKIFKRVRFSKRRFVAEQAEEWWKENKEKVFEKYSRTKSNGEASTSAAQPPPDQDPSTST